MALEKNANFLALMLGIIAMSYRCSAKCFRIAAYRSLKNDSCREQTIKKKYKIP
jgi:hypothetical protein